MGALKKFNVLKAFHKFAVANGVARNKGWSLACRDLSWPEAAAATGS